MSGVEPPANGFLRDVAVAERDTPLPPPPGPPPDPDDPGYVGDPAAFERDLQAHQAAAAAFTAAAQQRGGTVSQVISGWLAAAPLDMLQELLDQPGDVMPIFKPVVGPAVVARHEHVITCLSRHDLFTVAPYAAEMTRATDDKTKNPQAFSHFMLGTDDDALYRLDDVILRRVVSPEDTSLLAALVRSESECWTRRVMDSGEEEIDVVATIARSEPMRIVGDYLGVPAQARGAPSVLPALRAGDTFRLPADLERVYTFTKIEAGLVPTTDDLFGWVKDVFRNTFNNFNPQSPHFAEFRERGLIATEYLTAYIHAVVTRYKALLRAGGPVPDTMLTRLLRLQIQAGGAGGESLAEEFAAQLGAPLSRGELERRLSDSMIRSNVFGVVAGAVVNPQEATSRVADSILRLKDGEYAVRDGSGYDEAVRAAWLEEGDPGYAAGVQRLRAYALEALRLRPQGEVLLRLCAEDNAELGGVPVGRGTPVFVGFAGAQRDPAAVDDPLSFDVYRDEQLVPYLPDGERAREAPQSRLYLQHGYGRHKCLGRYASEICLTESLRALLRLGDLDRRSALEMDEQNLYAVRLRIGFAAGSRT
jgi:cytochrome P450